MKRIFALSLSILMCLTLVLGIIPVQSQAAGFTATTKPLETFNYNDQNYNNNGYDRSSTISSYLFKNTTSGYTRLEYDYYSKNIHIEVYNDELEFVSGKYMKTELSYFGGAYKNSKYYFLVFGQDNPKESNSKEVIRIVKYNLKWERLGAASVYGANTYIPFDAGCVRFAEHDGYLFIHTAHEMYASDDGLHHQANMTLTVKISSMTLTESCHSVAKYPGYVSHSFNQFILIPGGKVVTLDHGDGYPRAFRIFKYSGAAGSDKMNDSSGKYLDLFSFKGSIGDNNTGSTIGGFEYSGSSYLVAGTTVPHNKYDPDGQANIFVTATTRSNFTPSGTTFRYLTSYNSNANVDISTPHLIKLSANRFLIMWTEDFYTLRYAFLDGSGKVDGKIYSTGGQLSDCKPIVSDGKVIWYVTNYTAPYFFTLDLTTNRVSHEHLYVYKWDKETTYDTAGTFHGSCKFCNGKTGTYTAPAYKDDPDAYTVTPYQEGYPHCYCNGYLYIKLKSFPVITAFINHPPLGHNYETTVLVEPTCHSHGQSKTFCTMCGISSTSTLPALQHEYVTTSVPVTCIDDGITTHTCKLCNDSYTEVTPAPGHQFVTGVRKPNCFWEGRTTHRCTVCEYTYYDNYLPKTQHNHVITATIEATCTEDGCHTYVCMNCGDAYTEKIPMLGHDYNTVTVEATCSQEGSITHTCTRCGDSSSECIPFLPHSGNSYTLVEHPTDYAVGIALSECTVCHMSFSVGLPPLRMGNYRYVVYRDATCEEDGSAAYEYDAPNGSVIKVWDGLYATGHSFSEGTCATCGAADPDYVKPVTLPSIDLQYPSLSFEDTIIMNIYYRASGLEDVTEMGLITYSEEVSAYGLETAEQVIPGYAWSDTDGMYYSSTAGIAPKDIGDTIYFAVYYKLTDGTVGYTRLIGYSPKTYAANQLQTADAGMRSLVAAMLSYGAAAQKYFGYKADTLVSDSLTDDLKELVSAYDASMITTIPQASGAKLGQFINDRNYAKRYPTISFEGAFCINYYFQPTQNVVGDVTMYLWTSEDYNRASVLTRENATKAVKMELTATGEYLAAVDGIAAKDLDKAAYVTFCYTDGTTEYCSGVIGYSIGSYCATQAAKAGALADLAAATAVYGYYAKQMFGA